MTRDQAGAGRRAAHRALILAVQALLLVFFSGCGDGDEAETTPDTAPGELVGDSPAVLPPQDSAVLTDTMVLDTVVRETPPEPPEVDPARLREEEGVVGVTGTGVTPSAVLRPDDGPTLGLTGELARELQRLSGARVWVQGRAAATPVGAGIEVSAYRILEIEGRVPRVGILRENDGTWILYPDDGGPLVLLGLPATGVADGMKIWVVGEAEAEGRFRVESYGVVIPMAN